MLTPFSYSLSILHFVKLILQVNMYMLRADGFGVIK